MNARERFIEVLNFNTSVRTLNWEFGYWGGTLNRWYGEGLEKIDGLERQVSYGEGVCGPGLHWPMPSFSEDILKDKDVCAYFDFDEGVALIPYNYWIYPKFKKNIIHEDDHKRELIDIDGIRKIVKKDDSSIPFYLEWPVKNMKEWDGFKEDRLNVDSIKQRFSGVGAEITEKFKSRTCPLGLLGDPVGFFGSLRFLLGEVNLFMFYYDDPKLIKSIADYLCDFWIQICEELLGMIDVDCVFFWEDMSGKQGSLISPKTFREFMSPYYKRMIGFLEDKGLKHFIVDTDGNVEELIPLFLETGITGMYPFEIQAQNDILKIRSKYPKLQMFGGIDKNELTKDNKAIDAEVKKIDRMLNFGGYIPYADHLVPPNVSWENFVYYRNQVKKSISNKD
jgi:uroporphyrinogen decarboxylase